MSFTIEKTIESKNVDLPDKNDYQGKYIKLSPAIPSEDVSDLFSCSHGSVRKERLWTYMGYGPFKNKDVMEIRLNDCVSSNDPLFFTVHHLASNQRVGMTSFLNIVTEMQRLELGHIWYTPNFQQSNVNTETIYLMLCEAFDRLQYRKVEWKCDSRNTRSRTAALRLGFLFDRIFRKHMIVKKIETEIQLGFQCWIPNGHLQKRIWKNGCIRILIENFL